MKANGSSLWNRALNQMLSLATALAIVLAGAASTAFAQAKRTSPQKVAAVAAPAPEAIRAKKAPSQGGGPQEGIKVHGEWTIEVRNPDGTVAVRREFHNVHVSSFGTLPRLLGRQISPGAWIIELGDITIANPQACSTATTNLRCGLYEGVPLTTSSSVATASTTLSVSVVGLGTGLPRLLLTGSFTASAAATINTAFTHLTRCPATTAPATSCVPQGGVNPVFGFSQTGTGAFQPVSVVPGQIVQVTVAFSFS